MPRASALTFRADPRNLAAMKASLFSLVALAALSLALPFMPAPGEAGTDTGMLMIALIGGGMFGGMALATLRSLQRLPGAAVSLDTEGIWYTTIGRDTGLIPWDELHAVREGTLTLALKLYNASDEKLMRVEYQLQGFDTLRDILYDHVVDPHRTPDFPSTYTKDRHYHPAYAAIMALLVLFGIVVGTVGKSVLGVFIIAILAIMLAYDYLWSVYSITLHEQYLQIRYPLSSHRIKYADIAKLDMTDSFHRGYRHPEIRILAKSGQSPHKLKRLGIDTNELYRLLKATRVRTR